MTKIVDLTGVEVEHMVNARTGEPTVKVRALADGLVLLGQVDPSEARQIAGHLLEASARAEYEVDMILGLGIAGQATNGNLRMFLGAVRQGEVLRHTTTDGMADGRGLA